MILARIEDVADFVLDGTHASPVRTDFGIPVLSAQNVKDGVLTFETERYTTEEEYKAFNLRLPLRKGDVLLTIVGTIGRAAVISEVRPVVFQRSVAVIRPKIGVVDSRFLFHATRTQGFQAQLVRSSNQSSQAGVYLGKLKEVKLPLPSLAEQRRIAEILDRAEALRAKRRAALAQLDSLTQSIFLDLFGDPVTNAKGWPQTTPLGEVAHIVSGVTKGRDLEGKPTREVPYLAVINVQDRRLNLSVVKKIPATEDEIQQYRLLPQDLLLTEGGDPDKLGRGTLWNGELPECIHQNHVFRVRLMSPEVHPLFLNWLVGSSRGKKYFLRAAKQTTGIASINMTQLRGFPLLIPPLHLQREFANRVEAVEKLKADHLAALAELNGLFAALQYRAFRGDL